MFIKRATTRLVVSYIAKLQYLPTVPCREREVQRDIPSVNGSLHPYHITLPEMKNDMQSERQHVAPLATTYTPLGAYGTMASGNSMLF